MDINEPLPPPAFQSPTQPAAAPAPAPAPAAGTKHSFRFHGDGGTMFGLLIVNGLLTLVTLGIYHFWGVVKVRKYIMSQLELAGDRFAFHGNGKELLMAWLKLIGILLVGIICMGGIMAAFRGSPVAGLFALGFYAGMLCLIPYAIVGARRYALSRTSWRGIRFVFRGTAAELLPIFVKGALLTFVTLGIYLPYFISNLYAFLTNHSYYGTRRFEYTGKGEDLLWMHLKAILLFIPTLGLYSFWLAAGRLNYMTANTRIGGVRFRSTLTGGGLLGQTFVNMLLIFVTFGFATPWVIVRALRFRFENLHVEGSLDVSDIRQEIQKGGAMGQELAGLLDVDGGFGLGM